MSSNHIVHVSDANFETAVLAGEVPVLVDFWAEWCGPCRMIAPILDEVANEYVGRLQVAKLNIDESPVITARFGIRSIPTLIVFKGGEIAAQKVGGVSKSQLKAFIDAYL